MLLWVTHPLSSCHESPHTFSLGDSFIHLLEFKNFGSQVAQADLPVTCYVAQGDFELLILLSLLPSYGPPVLVLCSSAEDQTQSLVHVNKALTPQTEL